MTSLIESGGIKGAPMIQFDGVPGSVGQPTCGKTPGRLALEQAFRVEMTGHNEATVTTTYYENNHIRKTIVASSYLGRSIKWIQVSR
jgi:hypothetical protein